MPNPVLSARVDPAIVARVERCLDGLAARTEPGVRPADRGVVVRKLILMALPALEAQLEVGLPATKATARGRKRSCR